jgi:hypothetical protein
MALLSSGSAYATHYSGTDIHFVQYHFTSVAFGKKVRSVIVHTGVLQRSCSVGEIWTDVKDITLSNKGDHFNTRATLTASISSGCMSSEGVLAQYFVTFDDGSTLVTSPALVPTSSLGTFTETDTDGDKALREAAERLKTADDSTSTRGEVVRVGHAS